MKVAYDARHAARGLGISTFLRSLAAELVRLDDVSLWWLGDPAFAPDGVADVVRVDRRPYPMLDGPSGRALVARLGVDVMHFTGNTGWARRGPVPSVLTLHDLIFMTTSVRGRGARQIVGHRYERWLIPRAVAAADVVAVPSQTVADQVSGGLGAAASPVVVHEGVHAPAVIVAGAGDGVPYLVAFAGRDPRKRTADVVAAWRKVVGLPVHLKLLASGGLPPGVRESLAAELALGDAEILAHLPREELWRVLAGALALAYPSEDEGFGLPVLEAMAAGTPVLTGLAPVTREIGGDAIVPLDATDVVGSLAAAVRRLFGHPDEAAAIAERGRERAAAFSWRATAEAYRSLYRQAIEARGAG
jgi:glycosyltransferase involved in cell wall biosynthesis